MNYSEQEAREILGVPNSASYKEIKKAHRGLVNIFHPDRAATDQESQRKATESMTRINGAWAVIEERQAVGILGTKASDGESSQRDDSWRYTVRRPGKNECGICGSAPASHFTIKGIVVLIIGIAWPGYQGNLCKACARAFTREALRTSMMRGWWGAWFFLTPLVILYLIFTMAKIARMPEPTYRDYRVITPYDIPVSARPNPLKEPAALGAMSAGIIAVILALLVISNSNSSTTTSPNISTYDLNCWTVPNANNQLQNVSCNSPDAVYQTLSMVVVATDCPVGTVVELEKDSTGNYRCLGLKQ